MTQQAVKYKETVTEESKTKNTQAKILTFSVDNMTSLTKNSWSFWNSATNLNQQVKLLTEANPSKLVTIGIETSSVLAKVGAVIAEGLEEIGRHYLALLHDSCSASLSACSKYPEVRAPGDWINLQIAWVNRMVTIMASETNEISSLSANMANKLSDPIQVHLNKTYVKYSNTK